MSSAAIAPTLSIVCALPILVANLPPLFTVRPGNDDDYGDIDDFFFDNIEDYDNDGNHHHHHVHHQQYQPGLPRQAGSREPGRSNQEDEAGGLQVPAQHDQDVNEGDDEDGGDKEVTHITNRGHLHAWFQDNKIIWVTVLASIAAIQVLSSYHSPALSLLNAHTDLFNCFSRPGRKFC